MTFEELRDIMINFNKTSRDGKLTAKIIFKESNWEHKYTLDERTYVVTNDNKGFGLGHCSNSIFASCVAPYTDQWVRLDWYMQPYDSKGWEVEYCEIIDVK